MVNLKKIKLPKISKKIYLPILALIGLYSLILVYALVVGLIIKKPAIVVKKNIKDTAIAIQNKDLNSAESSLKLAQENFQLVHNKAKLVGFVRFVPFLSGYIKDLNHGLTAGDYAFETGFILLDAVKPYVDVLGFSGAEAQMDINSTEEKIIFILETLDKISPQLEEVSKKVDLIETEIASINPRRYPKTIKDQSVRGQLVAIQQSLLSSKESLANIKPLLALLPRLLGQPNEQHYLLIFQNDTELRPSGGFLTAYAILQAHKGKITPLISQDIYELDAKFGNQISAPEPIKKYLPLVNFWHLRDMNLSPDFKVSMDQFIPNYKKVAVNKDFDGVIAMDTNIVVDLLKILGPVGVANWGEYHADIIPECNCPQVVYKMEDYATRPTYYIKQNRKGMIGPLMHSILLNIMNSPKKLWPQFVDITLKNIQEKHIMFYFPEDEEMQQVAESFNSAGRIKDFEQDYFHLNDTNFAGAKSNMYVDQSVKQEIEVSGDGTVTKTVTLEYINPEPPDDCNLESGGLCLNGLLRDWVRIYVPEGSQLVEVLGSDIDENTFKDLGKTVIEAFIELRPESKTKLIIKYQLPFKYDNSQSYKMLIQKQPGTKNHSYTVSLGSQVQQFELDADKEIVF